MRVRTLLSLAGLAAVLAAPAPAEAQTRYVRYEHEGRTSWGVLDGSTIRELDGNLFEDPRPTDRTRRLSEVRLLVPVDPMRTNKVVGTAVNTRRPGLELPENAQPRWFAKFPTALNAHEGDVELPPEAGNLNYEGELVVVIGSRARNVARDDALDHVFGVAVGNDFSENTWYGENRGREEPTRLISKGSDTWAAMGPQLVAGVDFSDLAVETRLNGEAVQRGSTADLIQGVPELISNLSRYVTLLPGDVIYTGTVGFLPDVRRALRPGDVLEVEIEGLGTLRNTVVAMDETPGAGARSVAPSYVGGVDWSRVPHYEVDATFPKPLPRNWQLGQVSGVAIDSRDNVWIIHRPRTLTEGEAAAASDPPGALCCVPAPSVIQFDPDGNVLQAWGGPGHVDTWPGSEHGLYIDARDNLWTGSNGRGSTAVYKYAPDGTLLLTIGTPGDPGTGSNDPTHLNGPTDVFVDEEAREAYVADGYGNRRVIVFDSETGAYKRHWGAYGERPDDSVDLGDWDPDAPPPRHFSSPVHGLEITHDGLVYVADRSNRRIQVFRKDGTFVEERFLAPRTMNQGTVWDLAVSPDPEQRWMFVPDGGNKRFWVLRRSDLEPVASYGQGGRQVGDFNWVHNLAVDSRGRIYTTEVFNGRRVQRWLPRTGTGR